MFFKYLLTFILLLSNGEGENKNLILNNIDQFIKEKIKREILNIVYLLFLCALIVVSIVVAMVFGAEALHSYLLQYINGAIFEMIIFATIIASGVISLYFVLKQNKNKMLSIKPEEKNLADLLDFNLLAENFLEGFVESMNSKKATTS